MVAGTEEVAAAYSKIMTEFIPGRYYFKAFATNVGGTSYGSVKDFDVRAPMDDGPIKVFVNEQSLVFDVPPVIINDRTLVPLRAIFEALGADVLWDGETETVTATKGDVEVKLVIGGQALLNGQAVELDVPARIINDRTMVPLRFVSESLGYQVSWAEATRTINIRQ